MKNNNKQKEHESGIGEQILHLLMGIIPQGSV